MAPGWYRGEKLGKGGYGEVFIAVPEKPGQLMAVKSAPEHEADTLIKERDFLEKLAGVPGIVRCYGGEFTGENPRTFNLLLEYAPVGNLCDLISSSGLGIPERFVRVFTRSLLKALKTIHSRRWVHCDIKPDNILVFPPPPGAASRCDYELKIADFGLAVEMNDYYQCVGDYRGTARYMPPEMVNVKKVSPAMDVWALGCTVLEMLTGNRPWKGWSGKEEELEVEIGRGRHPVIPDWLCEEAKDFLGMCFENSWLRRANCWDLLRHPFAGGRLRVEAQLSEPVKIRVPEPVKARVPEPVEEARIPNHLLLPHLMFDELNLD